MLLLADQCCTAGWVLLMSYASQVVQAFSRQQYHNGSEHRVPVWSSPFHVGSQLQNVASTWHWKYCPQPAFAMFPEETCCPRRYIAIPFQLAQPSARSRTQWIAFARPWKKHDAEQLADEPTSGRGTGIWPRFVSGGLGFFVGSITGPMLYQTKMHNM